MGEKMKDKDLIRLEKRVKKLEKTIGEFMNNWGPDVQKRRAERDQVWDEMVRVVSIQKRGKSE